jgi:subtilisin family serine protease
MIGTSQATPHVSGAVALLYSASSGLIGQIERTKSIMLSNAKHESDGRLCGPTPRIVPNYTFGWGGLDIAKAVKPARR